MFPRPDGILLGGTFERRPVGRDARSRRRSPASSPSTSASSPPSAAPLEVAARAPDIAGEMNYHASIPQSGGEQAEVLKDKLTPKAIVAALNEHIVGQDDAKKRGRGRAAQPLAPPAARPRAARRGHAQEHPDDRAHRLRQDRDQPAAGEARRRAVRQGRGDQVHRGRLCRPRRRADRPRPRRGSRPARTRPAPRQGPRRAPRKRRWTGCSTR